MAKVNLFLEMAIGITGGEEDGVDNTSVKAEALYTKPEQVWNVYKALSKIRYGHFDYLNSFAINGPSSVLDRDTQVKEILIRDQLNFVLHLCKAKLELQLVFLSKKPMTKPAKYQPYVLHCRGLRKCTRGLQIRQCCP